MHEAPVAHGSSGHVLIVEDHPINQRVATAMLENLGYRVEVVADGAAAVAAARQTAYQSILMDLQLPVLDGFEAAAGIRADEGSARHTPIVALTASGSASDQQRCLDAGMDDYLVKPLSLDALAAVLSRWSPQGGDDMIVISADAPAGAGSSWSDQADQGRSSLDPLVTERLERLGAAAGEDLLGRLTTLYLADADGQILALRDALAANDLAGVVRPAHTLSGASANLGAADLARMCAELASDGAAGDLIGGSAVFHAIEAELGRVRVALLARVAPA